MTTQQRRDEIICILKESNKPIKGNSLSERFNVTRQVIVKDIAILRASGIEIIATPEGYIFNSGLNKIKRIIAVNHDKSNIQKELEIIISHGGIVEDVIIEHLVYGEIKASLMIKNIREMRNFINKFNQGNMNPLLELTEGVHLHTIYADTEEDIDNILLELEKENFLVR